MGAVTDIALELAREIAGEDAGDSYDGDMLSWAQWQILGVWRLAMRLDYDAAAPALDEFRAIAGVPKALVLTPEASP